MVKIVHCDGELKMGVYTNVFTMIEHVHEKWERMGLKKSVCLS